MYKIKNRIINFFEVLFDRCYHQWEHYTIYEKYYTNENGDDIYIARNYKKCIKCGKIIK